MSWKTESLDLNSFCVNIESEERIRRKRALEDLNKNIFGTDCAWAQRNFSEFWETVNKHLAKSLVDSAECCRILSVEIWKNFLNVLPVNERNIQYLMPILSKRLKTELLQERSEEVRLKYVSLLRLVIDKYKQYLSIYLDNLIIIFARTVADNYPEIKRESCECIEELASSVPADFYSRSESLVKPILGNFSHQHYRIRAASVKAIGKVLQYGNSKSMEEVSTPLAQRLFDQSGAVRLAVVEVAGSWFVELRDRYSWWHKLIPLLLTGLHDEVFTIRNRAEELWAKAGELYIKENENDERLKDKLDFLNEDLRNNKFSKTKPNVGCQTIVQQNLCKLVGGITRELGDWLADVRVRSAQLLCVLVINAEEDITQHLEKLLPAMYRACNDEDPRVAENVELAAKNIGVFVRPAIYCPIILPTLEENLTPGHLRVFAAVLKSSKPVDVYVEFDKIVEFLVQPHVYKSRKVDYQKQLFACCEAILTSSCEDPPTYIVSQLYVVIFTLFAMWQEEASIENVEHLFELLPSYEKAELIDVHIFHLQYILEPMKESCRAWNIHSDDFIIFSACLSRIPSATQEKINLLLPIIKTTTSAEADPELRLKVLILLGEFFDFPIRASYKTILLKDVLMPALVWSAGRTAEAIRTAAVCCVCSLLKPRKSRKNDESGVTKIDDNEEGGYYRYNGYDQQFGSLELCKMIIPLLVSLIDDNAKKTRFYALRAICLLTKRHTGLLSESEEYVHAIYPSVLKRLDDGCDDVRVAAIETLVSVWQLLPKNYDLVINRSHVDYLYTTTIIHLDDPDPKFQELIFDALLKLAKIHPELLETKLQNCRDNFRNRDGLNKLLNSCHDLLRSKE